MSKFFGQTLGYTKNGSSRTIASRTGSEGIRSSAQSRNGSIQCELSYNSDDKLNVRLECSEGSRFYGSKTLFDGSFEDLQKAFDLLRDIESGKCSVVRHRQK